MVRYVLAIVLALATTPAAQAQYEGSANQLLEYCTNEEALSAQGICLGYIIAATSFLGKYRTDVCLPGSYTNGQVKRVLVKFLEDNPHVLDLRAVDIVDLAVLSEFGCEKQP